MKAISKDLLKGKYVSFIDKRGTYRCQKVMSIRGNVLTVKDSQGKKQRIPLHTVRGRQLKKKLQPIEELKKTIVVVGDE